MIVSFLEESCKMSSDQYHRYVNPDLCQYASSFFFKMCSLTSKNSVIIKDCLKYDIVADFLESQ